MSFDYQIFSFIYQLSGNPIFDWLMVGFSSEKLWGLLATFVCFFLIWKKNKKALLKFFVIAVTLGVNDLVSARVLKPYFARLRPCRAFPDTVQVVKGWCGGDFGFPSNHASNTAVVITMLWFFTPKPWRYLILVLGLTVGFSRVYLGVHYPGDILAGYVLGSIFGIIGHKVLLRLEKSRLKNQF